ncbi:UDP-glucuronosyltransferase 2B11 isoform X2 [Symphalangus syndactylus]|uniref:UDP-glucuronosyltransferase 2B11 isoform X2 n=1 Tax=Symphalangus syndactylus TaxID=9590 RepID=UPI002442CF53|nr:UDP-glucuronosyltransferase 2B11 isoform X2 [Symphalangus syndactylus]
MALKWTSVLLLMHLSCYFSSGSCGKVLVWAAEYSHWMNMKTILKELVQRGHEVTVLASSASILFDPNDASTLKLEVYPTSLTKTEFENIVMQQVKRWSDIQKDSFWLYFSQEQEILWELSDIFRNLCKDVVSNKKLMKKLQESRFDIIFADPVFPCGRPTTLFETMRKADIWLMRNSWNFKFPHPFFPNVDFVGGLHCKPAKPLPKEMEEFVQSSGENGVVVFSLGSVIRNITAERANVVATALAQIPQKVLWKFDGNKPDALGLNTRLYKWIPQNDLLGHPKTRAFITHGGANGIYEAIYHGIPMVGIPFFWDQPGNIAHMEAKGAAVRLDFHTMSSTDLLNALKTVINDPSYKENVMKLSRIQHDQPVKPLDRAVFWIEFVMRHKGAKHLRVAAHDLTWFQYHSLDVIGFLLACVATVIFIITKFCLFCFWKFARKGKKGKRD